MCARFRKSYCDLVGFFPCILSPHNASYIDSHKLCHRCKTFKGITSVVIRLRKQSDRSSESCFALSNFVKKLKLLLHVRRNEQRKHHIHVLTLDVSSNEFRREPLTVVDLTVISPGFTLEFFFNAIVTNKSNAERLSSVCLLYTSDAADEL